MNLNNLLNFLQTVTNKQFFAELQNKKKITINETQALLKNNPEKPIKDILSLIELQNKTAKRVQNSRKYLFTPKSSEQCSSTALAGYHASKTEGLNTIADLCCGAGMDLLQMAKNKTKVFAVDADEKVLHMAEYNAKAEGLDNVNFICGKAEDFAEEVEAIFIDPDRRVGNRRQTNPEEYLPKLSEVLKLHKNLLVKLSPATDYKNLLNIHDSTLEFVSENGVMKEILLCTGIFAEHGIKKKAVILPHKIILNESETQPEFSKIKQYIFEPDAAVIKAGLVCELGSELGFSQMYNVPEFLTGNREVFSEFGTLYEVLDIRKFTLRIFQKYVKENKIGVLELKTKGFYQTVEDFRKKLKLKGKNKALIMLIRQSDEYNFLILKRKR
jgi:SAM-dependent methyltransferase